MRRFQKRFLAAILWAACATWVGPVFAAPCPGTGSFETWLDNFKRTAAAQGISRATIDSALDGISFDPSIVARDHGQGVFRQSFEQFSGRMVSPYRLKKGAGLIKKYAEVFRRIEQQFGVPAPVVVAIWGLETDFGANSGNFPTLRSLATLAYDCRRSPMFTAELVDALRLIQAGDLTPDEMRGAWAGELGQTQFMPSSYFKFAVDYEGNGHRDLIRSVPDVLASTANYLRSYGWQRGQPWGEGTANFQVLLEWNKSTVYTKTVAYFASRLAGNESE
ncbi:MAG: lytic murein transglycosylase [Methylobacteriaceae bacterium]|nr:lytic murein transglycosylase [Methylobacteriaceae bacterium]MBV9219300.1 lytic murein transglycosylase [Methylobacteriaceae bacterium]MBV9244044.1 lytic murein transglycosylase [Methylobacteriaceae bacterium]MBV9633211.1 lytic murein transglycosylase [Methylobacteriaceae bacterium]MBV9703222.1 lytic murein transglycosylase [Methylobacteriaceae bacterium]